MNILQLIHLTTYKYNFKNDINFTYDSDIEDFTNDNSLILTNYDQESVSKFMSELIQRVQAINKRDMEKLGVNESENPIFQAIPSISISPLGLNQTTMTNNGMSELAINTFNNKSDLSIKVIDDSMSPIYLKNDKVYLKKQEDYKNGDDIIIAVKNNVLSVRRLYRYPKGIILQALNPKYPTINVNIISNNMILGKVVAVYREIK